MDAEGLGRKLLLTPCGNPRRAPEKQTVGTVTASHKMITLQALLSSLNASTAKRGCLGRGEAFGCPPAVCPPKRPRPFAHYGEAIRIFRVFAWSGLKCKMQTIRPGPYLSTSNMTGPRFHRAVEMIPALAFVVKKTPLFPPLLKKNTEHGDARGASEV